MSCRVCVDLLQRRLDGVAAAATPAEAEHLTRCVVCKSRVAAAGRLAEGLRASAPPALPFDLGERVVAGVLKERSRRRRRWTVATCMVAAAALVALTVKYAMPFERQGRVPEAVVVAERSNVETEVGRPVLLRQSMAEAGDAVAALTTRTAEEALEPARHFLPVVAAAPAAPKPAVDAGVRKSDPLAEVGQTVSAGLEPVTDSARRAFGLFLRDVPAGDGAKSGL